jgi:uncharacterized protein YoxC
MSDTAMILGIASLVVAAGFSVMVAWIKSVGNDVEKLRDGHEQTVAQLREQLSSRINILMSDTAELKVMVRELDQYIKHNASDLWDKRDELSDRVSKIEGRLDHVSSELARICKEK